VSAERRKRNLEKCSEKGKFNSQPGVEAAVYCGGRHRNPNGRREKVPNGASNERQRKASAAIHCRAGVPAQARRR
jgi:hypothetical protein